MAEDGARGDQSMEDILASIRKIISDDGEEVPTPASEPARQDAGNEPPEALLMPAPDDAKPVARGGDEAASGDDDLSDILEPGPGLAAAIAPISSFGAPPKARGEERSQAQSSGTTAGLGGPAAEESAPVAKPVAPARPERLSLRERMASLDLKSRTAAAILKGDASAGARKETGDEADAGGKPSGAAPVPASAPAPAPAPDRALAASAAPAAGHAGEVAGDGESQTRSAPRPVIVPAPPRASSVEAADTGAARRQDEESGLVADGASKAAAVITPPPGVVAVAPPVPRDVEARSGGEGPARVKAAPDPGEERRDELAPLRSVAAAPGSENKASGASVPAGQKVAAVARGVPTPEAAAGSAREALAPLAGKPLGASASGGGSDVVAGRGEARTGGAGGAIPSSEAMDVGALNQARLVAGKPPAGAEAVAKKAPEKPSAALIEAAREALHEDDGAAHGAASGSAKSGAVTLEEVVREALKPVLKAWLDENLTKIIEEQVRGEVRRALGPAKRDGTG